MRWSDEMVETATQMWSEGHSGTEIALALGGGLTKNSVIGKMHRLEQTQRRVKRRSVVSEKAAKPKANKSKAECPIIPASAACPSVETAAVPFERFPKPAGPSDIRWPEGVGLLEATMMHCRAVQDERGSDGLAMFCGHPVHVRPDGARSSWCIEHLRRFVDPAFLDQALTGGPVRTVRRSA